MADDDLGADNFEDDDQPAESEQQTPKALRDAEKRAQKRASDAEARAEAAERRAVFAELGVPDSGPGRLIRETFTGEPTREAVEEFAERYEIPLGGPSPAAPPPAQPAATEEVAGQQQLRVPVTELEPDHAFREAAALDAADRIGAATAAPPVSSEASKSFHDKVDEAFATGDQEAVWQVIENEGIALQHE